MTTSEDVVAVSDARQGSRWRPAIVCRISGNPMLVFLAYFFSIRARFAVSSIQTQNSRGSSAPVTLAHYAR